MRFVVRSSIVFVVFWFNAAAAQEGYLGHATLLDRRRP